MLEFITSFAQTNPLVAGMGGATAAGMAIAHAKSLPGAIWGAIKHQFSVSLTVYSEDKVFENLERWLAAQPSTLKMRRLNLAEWYERSARRGQPHEHQFDLSPGAGHHLIWIDGRPFTVHRQVQEDKTGGDTYDRKRKQTLTITTPGRSQQPIRDLLAGVRHVQADDGCLPVYLWNGMEPVMVDRRPKRSMDTVYIDAAIKAEMIGDIQNFFASQALYRHRGTPWRRGYMLCGSPRPGQDDFDLRHREPAGQAGLHHPGAIRCE